MMQRAKCERSRLGIVRSRENACNGLYTQRNCHWAQIQIISYGNSYEYNRKPGHHLFANCQFCDKKNNILEGSDLRVLGTGIDYRITGVVFATGLN